MIKLYMHLYKQKYEFSSYLLLHSFMHMIYYILALVWVTIIRP